MKFCDSFWKREIAIDSRTYSTRIQVIHKNLIGEKNNDNKFREYVTEVYKHNSEFVSQHCQYWKFDRKCAMYLNSFT